MTIPVYSVAISEYNVREKPNSKAVGAKIDAVIKKHFLGQSVAIRCLGSQEHKQTSADLVKLIKKLGTDNYDPDRKGENYENVEGKKIDFFALDFKISEKGKYMGNFIEPFYTYPKMEGKPPIRIDIILIYDRSKLRRVLHRYKGRTDIKRDGFVFKDPKNKLDALMGIIKVL